jgi:ATP-dependent RNA helicase RhlE
MSIPACSDDLALQTLARTGSAANAGERAEPPAVAVSDLSGLRLHPVLLRALRAAGYEGPTPIQRQAIPPALEGRDVLACAQAEAGKTAAIVLPVLQHLLPAGIRRAEAVRIRAVVLAPTRELVTQIAESIGSYGRGTGLRHLAVFSGVSQAIQSRQLQRGVDVVVATPDRLADLIDRNAVCLDSIEMLVIDELASLLEQGFLPALRRVVRSVPAQRQTLLFSATLPRENESVVKQLVRDPVCVSVARTISTPTLIEQAVWFADQVAKPAVLEKILRDPQIRSAVVFTRTKHGANRVTRHLVGSGIDAQVIHGNQSQKARDDTIGRFCRGDLRVLVTTDIAARGVDIAGISHVINFDLPTDAESYLHRIARTARAGRTGAAFSLCTADERSMVSRIERLVGQPLRAMNQPSR